MTQFVHGAAGRGRRGRPGAALAAAVCLWAGACSPSPDVEIDATPRPRTAAEFGAALYDAGRYARAANALSASFRDNPTAATHVDLLRARLAAGQYDDALRDATQVPVDADDAWRRAAAIIRGEAYLRLQMFDRAEAEAVHVIERSAAAGRRDLEATLLAARAASALGRREDASGLVAAALADPAAVPGSWIVGEASMIEARLALDANKLDAAGAELARAAGAGVDRMRVEAGEVEILIRSGETEAARKALADRAAVVAAAAHEGRARLDVRALHLEAMLAYAAGDAPEAVRQFNVIEPWLRHQHSGVLEIAAAKARGGDAAQAAALTEDAIRAAPGHWVGYDLAAAAGDTGAEEALIELRPWLGAYRRARRLADAGEPDAAFAAALAPLALGRDPDAVESVNDGGADGAVEFLFGRAAGGDGSVIRRYLADLSDAAGGSVQGAAEDAPAPFGDRIATTMKARGHLVRGEPEVALRILGAELEPDLEFAGATLLAAFAQAASGAPEAALAELARGGEGAPGMALSEARARIYAAAGRYSEAIVAAPDPSAEPGLFLAEEVDRAAAFRGALLMAAKDKRGLVAFARAMRREFGTSPETARLLAAAGETDAALTVWRAVAQANPDDPAYVGAFVAAMRAHGKRAEADAFLDALRRRRPEAAAAAGLQAATLVADPPEPALTGVSSLWEPVVRATLDRLARGDQK